jgi:DMSO/TMAO reductase YedYZ molybdopterin-dependent catalytic subunit
MAADLRRGVLAGAIGGLVAVAAMYLGADLTGVAPLPRRLQDPLLGAMPGPLFGFLIDRLQHLGKVLEEIGLIAAMVAGLAVLGAFYSWLRGRGAPRPALLTGLAAWLVSALVLLPWSGAGLLGLQEGIVTPIVLLAVFTVYGIILELAYSRLTHATTEADRGRRRLLLAVPAGLGGLALVLLGARLGPGWYATAFRPAESGLTGPVPELTPPDKFYIVSKNISDPMVSEKGWSLRVQGLVDRPLRIGYQELKLMPAVTQYVTLECVSNNVGGPQISTGRFTGVSLAALLNDASPRPGAGAVGFKARDGYTESLPLSFVLGSPQILVAYLLDDAPLTPAHGFPARILIPGRYGMKGPKWLDEIDLITTETGGYWEGQGWDSQAVVKTMARIDSPGEGDLVRAGQVQVAGVAFAGNRGITAVEVSTDGGTTWHAAQLRPPLSPLTWVLWSYSWSAGSGSHTLKARARDGEGSLQTSRTAPSYPSGSTGYHSVQVQVSR